MQNCKYFHKFLIVIILIMIFCNKSEGTCGHHKHHHHHATSTTPKYYIKTDTIMTSNPEIKIDCFKCSSKDRSKIFYVSKKAPIEEQINSVKYKTNELIQTIFNALQGHAHKTTATTARPISTTTPHQSTNMQVTNHVVNGHSYVYNIQNHGTHYHYYGSPSTGKSNPHEIDIVPLVEKKPNEDRKKTGWNNDVKLS
ncbi:uncharacterized protein LOC135957444 [Calliphora vicina]|uniref:uncharacterized protein LOC135957444 n=1 Tax=Calliphora vicina TaxID=7373 RepID=UPI00325AD1FD